MDTAWIYAYFHAFFSNPAQKSQGKRKAAGETQNRTAQRKTENGADGHTAKTKANPSPNGNGLAFHLFGDLAGNRTRDCAVRGRRLNLLTTRPRKISVLIISHRKTKCKRFCLCCEKFFGRFRPVPLASVPAPLKKYSPPQKLRAFSFLQTPKQHIHARGKRKIY